MFSRLRGKGALFESSIVSSFQPSALNYIIHDFNAFLLSLFHYYRLLFRNALSFFMSKSEHIKPDKTKFGNQVKDVYRIGLPPIMA